MKNYRLPPKHGIKPEKLAWLVAAIPAIIGAIVFTFPQSVNAVPAPPVTAPAPESNAAPPDQGETFCLSCHATSKLTMTLGAGETLNLDMEQERYLESIHGEKLTCTDCHKGYAAPPHVLITADTKREYSLANYELCKRCHFTNYTKTLDSIHFQVLEQGNPQTALCVDCHGYHYVTRAGEPRSGISKTCSQCHADIYSAYTASIHGSALAQEDNPDVPVCTDCHGVHNIVDPRTASFRLNIPELCGKCHTDSRIMSKYGLSTAVLKTYLQDFHGTTNTLLQEQSPLIWSKEAVCTDCHGIHDITKIDDPQSRVLRANLVKTCQECHPDATDNFPAAWLSHYEPSLTKAPLVFLVDIFYKIFIPFIAGGMVIHVFVDLWRILSGRK